MLALSPGRERPGYFAVIDALASLFHAASTILGGVLFDWLRSTSTDPAREPYRSCLIVLVLGLAMRSIAVVLAARIDEPVRGAGERFGDERARRCFRFEISRSGNKTGCNWLCQCLPRQVLPFAAPAEPVAHVRSLRTLV